MRQIIQPIGQALHDIPNATPTYAQAADRMAERATTDTNTNLGKVVMPLTNSAVGYYLNPISGGLEADRKRILEQMALGSIGSADLEERRRELRAQQAPASFPAAQLKTLGYTDSPEPAWKNEPVLGIKSKPRFVAGFLSAHLPMRSTYHSGWGEANSEYDNPQIANLKDNQVIVVPNGYDDGKHYVISKENNRVFRYVIDDSQLAAYKQAMRSGLPIDIGNQILVDNMGSMSQTIPNAWQTAIKYAPSSRYELNQITFKPFDQWSLFSGDESKAAGFVRLSNPTEIYVNNKYLSQNDLMNIIPHETGHLVDTSPYKKDVKTYFDLQVALEGDLYDQRHSPNLQIETRNFETPTSAESYMWSTPQLGDRGITKYGQTDPREAFAELFSFYLNQRYAGDRGIFYDRNSDRPISFDELYPRTAEFFDKELGNIYPGEGLEPAYPDGPVREAPPYIPYTGEAAQPTKRLSGPQTYSFNDSPWWRDIINKVGGAMSNYGNAVGDVAGWAYRNHPINRLF
jgi:hypothetical protein